MGGSVWVCLCQHHGWFGARPAEPVEMKLGVIKIPWKTRVLCTYNMGNTSLANEHNNTKDDWCERVSLWSEGRLMQTWLRLRFLRR